MLDENCGGSYGFSAFLKITRQTYDHYYRIQTQARAND